jgi:hypothetical protein
MQTLNPDLDIRLGELEQIGAILRRLWPLIIFGQEEYESVWDMTCRICEMYMPAKAA